MYIVDISDSSSYDLCILALLQNSYDFWLLGDAFLRSYYVIHDDTNEKISLAPSVGSYVSSIEKGDTPDKEWSSTKVGFNYYFYKYFSILWSLVTGLLCTPVVLILGGLLWVFMYIFSSQKPSITEASKKKLADTIAESLILGQTPNIDTEKTEISSSKRPKIIVL
jgi:hypothetical protein